jgi:hypothetical protein
MDQAGIERAVELGKKSRYIFIGTTDSEGVPHLAAAGDIQAEREGRVSLSEWFCPTTTENQKHNKWITIAVWDTSSDSGSQLLGEVEDVNEASDMDGYDPALERSSSPPQVEWKITVRVRKILAFSKAPHSDLEE